MPVCPACGCHICGVIARNTNISTSVTSGRGEDPSSNSVKVAVEVSLSLHHQQYDNFRKHSKKTLIWLQPPFYMWRFFCFHAPWGPPLKVCTSLLWGSENVYCEEVGVWTSRPGPLWKISSSSEAFEGEKNNRTRDLRMLVGPVAGVTPLDRFKKNSLVLRSVAARGPCFVTLAVPEQFRYSA